MPDYPVKNGAGSNIVVGYEVDASALAANPITGQYPVKDAAGATIIPDRGITPKSPPVKADTSGRTTVASYPVKDGLGNIIVSTGGGSVDYLAQDMAALGALAYWPLTDPAGSTQAAEKQAARILLPAGALTASESGVTLSGGHLYRAATDDFNAELAYNAPKTWEIYVNPSLPRGGANAEHALIAKRDDTGTAVGWMLYMQWVTASGRAYPAVILRNATTSYRLEPAAGDWPNGTAYHLMVQHSGLIDASVRMTMWVDGRPVTLSVTLAWGSPADPSITNPHPLALGARRDATGNAASQFPGLLKGAAIYGSALTQDDAIYHACLVRDRQPVIPVKATNLIVSTDMHADCDDVVALLCAARLHQLGEVSLRAVVADSCGHYAAALADTLLRANGLSVPVGAYKGSVGPGSGDSEGTTNWVRTTALQFSGLNSGPKANYSDDVTVLRTALAGLPAGQKAVIAGVGTLNCVAGLLASSADGISPLTGAELIEARAERLLVMGGSFSGATIGGSNYNFTQSPAAASAVFAGWPTAVPIIAQGADVGQDVMSSPGASAVANPTTSPAGKAWSLTTGLQTGGKRSSWDPMAVVSAVRGNQDWLRSVGVGGTIAVNSGTGVNDFTVGLAGNHHFQRKTKAAAAVGAEIDALVADLM